MTKRLDAASVAHMQKGIGKALGNLLEAVELSDRGVMCASIFSRLLALGVREDNALIVKVVRTFEEAGRWTKGIPKAPSGIALGVSAHVECSMWW